MPAPTLAEAIAQYGRDAYLLTVASDGPHTSFVSVDLKGNVISCAVGKSAARNIASVPNVSLFWPPREPGGLCSRRQWHSDRTARGARRDQGGNHADQVSPSSRGTEASRQRRAVRVRLPAHREAGITTQAKVTEPPCLHYAGLDHRRPSKSKSERARARWL